jgi:hypothetical protein
VTASIEAVRKQRPLSRGVQAQSLARKKPQLGLTKLGLPSSGRGSDPIRRPLTVPRYVVGNVKRFPKILRTVLGVRALNSATHCAERLALAMKMNPEQGTRSGFTTRCCLSSWDLNYSGGVGGGGTPLELAISKHALDCEHLRIMSHREWPLRVSPCSHYRQSLAGR